MHFIEKSSIVALVRFGISPKCSFESWSLVSSDREIMTSYDIPPIRQIVCVHEHTQACMLHGPACKIDYLFNK